METGSLYSGVCVCVCACVFACVCVHRAPWVKEGHRGRESVSKPTYHTKTLDPSICPGFDCWTYECLSAIKNLEPRLRTHTKTLVACACKLRRATKAFKSGFVFLESWRKDSSLIHTKCLRCSSFQKDFLFLFKCNGLLSMIMGYWVWLTLSLFLSFEPLLRTCVPLLRSNGSLSMIDSLALHLALPLVWTSGNR